MVKAVWTANGWVPVIALFVAGLAFNSMESIRQLAEGNREELKKIAESKGTATHYSNAKEFYEALTSAVKEADFEVRATYFRRVPPTYDKAARDYFRACISWVQAKSHRKLLRVMPEPATPAMREWVEEQREHSKRRLRKGAYKLKYIQIDVTNVLSIAVIDEKTVFCAITMDDDVVRGYSLTSPDLGNYYKQYHQMLLNSGKEVF
ncbi:hypothetical protein [Streptomyces achromogenes]|uniref:Uncharacterized protein n=2 Tax=Streptomyces achromogenes TaxID=67255 RepID=A0ABZ1KI62_STRAH